MALDQDECELAGAGYSSVADLRVLDDIFEGRGLYFQPAEIENETLHPGHHISNSRVHVVLLNWQLLPGDRLLKLLRAATSITCVDGGALRLLDRLWEYDLPTIADVFYLQGTETKKELRIIGDMDSINEHHERRWDSITGQEKSSLKTLIKFGFKVIQIVDDYSTDFEKARRNLEETGVIQEGDIVLVDGALGGRFDQQMSHLAILYRAKYPAEISQEKYVTRKSKINYRTILIGEESFLTLLDPGTSLVLPPLKAAEHVCGLLPLVPCESVSTKNLRWDLTDVKMSMNGMFSSSNEIAKEQNHVVVKSTDPIVWFSRMRPQ